VWQTTVMAVGFGEWVIEIGCLVVWFDGSENGKVMNDDG
jgi:hypothetical protein